ncbi:Rne/Rng family ribonuclease [Acidobacteria bacterium AH-259-O06]|nr:Rne/Rng family ribonuclease [Acidobacteria bacterium AH-259-O06]
MSKELVISSTSLETRLAILEDNQVTEIFIERTKNKGNLGNIYRGKVTRVLPGMQAAFVDIGLERDAFLYVSDFFEDYEEYEALFVGEDEGYEELVLHQSYQASDDAGEPSRAGRRSRRQEGKRMDRREFPSEIGQILPEKFESTHSISLGAVQQSESESLAEADNPEILPLRLQTLVQYEPESPREEQLPQPEARLDEKPDLHRSTSSRDRHREKRNSFDHREGRILIGDLLREGQEILVQVAKEPIAKKGPRITSHVALPGRYLVFMPTVEHVGVSRRIVSEKERNRLKDIVMKLREDSGKGFIVRTVGENHEETDFAKDMAYLTKLWEDIRKKAERLSAPSLLYAEPGLVHRVVRDYFSVEFRAIRVDDEQEYERIVDFVNKFNPELVNRIRLYNKNRPIFDQYGINAEIEKALRQKIWLKSGGYIVIHQTEALVSIDVNTGKFVGKTNSLEDTITKTNLDAAREVVRQIRLRNLGGIIVIDFIDMDEKKNRLKVMEELQRELAKDKSPSRILQFNEFGLVAITRRRVKQSLERVLCQPCIFCNGSGMTKSVRSICYSIHEEVQKMVPYLEEGQEILIRCHPDVGKALRNRERHVLRVIEEMTGKVVSIKTDPLMHIEQFDL